MDMGFILWSEPYIKSESDLGYSPKCVLVLVLVSFEGRSLYWLVLCVNLTQAGVIIGKGASVGEVPP